MTRSATRAPAVTAMVTRLDSLATAVDVLRPCAPGPVGTVDSWLDLARGRIRHGAQHTVVALAGTTGSGKSSLLNALAGTGIASTGVTRPTTATAQALVVDAPGETTDDGAAAVLDWLDVSRRHHLTSDAIGDDLAGLVLLDLPDIDSVETSHHLEAARLVGVVDLVLWVTDPQKYADRTLHSAHLAPLSAHAGSIGVLLNKVDTLTADDARACLRDLDRLLDTDGLRDVRPMAVSASTGEGLTAVHGLLAAEIRARRAMLDRIGAGLVEHTAMLVDVVGSDDRTGRSPDAGAALHAGLTEAIGIDGLGSLVAVRHRRAATLRTGWPVMRWRRRLRPRPAAGAHQPGRSAVARAVVSGALRDLGDRVAETSPPAVRDDVRALVESRGPDVVEALDRTTTRLTDGLSSAPRWWSVVAALQTLLLAVAGAGLGWLLGVTLAEATLRLDPDPLLPLLDDAIPVPTAMLVGGLVLGVVVGVLASVAARVGAARRARRVRAAVTAAVADVADVEVLSHVASVSDDLDRARRALAAAAHDVR